MYGFGEGKGRVCTSISENNNIVCKLYGYHDTVLSTKPGAEAAAS